MSCPLPKITDPGHGMVRVEIARQVKPMEQLITDTHCVSAECSLLGPMKHRDPGPTFTHPQAWRAFVACVLWIVLAYAVAHCARQLATL